MQVFLIHCKDNGVRHQLRLKESVCGKLGVRGSLEKPLENNMRKQDTPSEMFYYFSACQTIHKYALQYRIDI